MSNPKLRYGLEALPVQHEGRKMILLRDRLGYCSDSLLLSPELMQLLIQMDGRNSVRDLQLYHMRATGELLFQEKLEEVLKKLDEHLFLENERFIEHVAGEAARFLNDPVRRMYHAGKSFPLDPQPLRDLLGSFYLPENGGPGIPRPGTENRPLLGLMAPHIDLQAGGPCFAHAYKVCCEVDAPRTWVVLGTGHEPVDNCFAVTDKDFETPLGLVRCDHAFTQELIRRAPRDVRASEYNHRMEHTIEFQAVFLAHVQPGASIVPVLCSFSVEDNQWSAEQAYVDEVAGILRSIADESEGRVGFLASVDLAHIGPRYGDAFRPGPVTVAEHLAADRSLLESLERCDPSQFIRKIRREGNRRRICGVAPLYVLTRVLEGRAFGEILHHTHAVVDQQGSFVTFASTAFYAA